MSAESDDDHLRVLVDGVLGDDARRLAIQHVARVDMRSLLADERALLAHAPHEIVTNAWPSRSGSSSICPSGIIRPATDARRSHAPCSAAARRARAPSSARRAIVASPSVATMIGVDVVSGSFSTRFFDHGLHMVLQDCITSRPSSTKTARDPSVARRILLRIGVICRFREHPRIVQKASTPSTMKPLNCPPLRMSVAGKSRYF